MRSEFFELQLLVFQPEFNIVKRSFYIGGIAWSKKLRQKTIAAVQLFPQRFTLLLQVRNFVAHALRIVEHGLIALLCLNKVGLTRNGHTGLLQKFLKKGIHGFESIRVAHIVAEKYVMFEEVGVILAAVQKNNSILQ